MAAKRSARERFPQVIAAAVRVFARDGYRSAHMSDVAREAGLSEAALYRYVDGKEDLFVLAIRHALLLEPLPEEDDPAGAYPLKAPALAEMIAEAREFVAAEVPFGSLAEALELSETDDPAAELEAIMRELFILEEQTSVAADMIERSARELPELADLLNSGLRAPVLAALTSYLESRAKTLRGVDFEVRSGEVFCLLGPNGAGKTTTVEILEGFRQRTSGTVSVLGLDPQKQPTRLRERIGIVLQECGFPRQARVKELIDCWRSYYPNPRATCDLLHVVELTEDKNTQVRKLSGGQRRRLDLALALAGDPDLIFLDEPTTGFDPESRRRCWEAIENLRALGKTILLTTHYLDEAERLADRVAILQDGQIQIAGTVRHVARQAAVPTKISFTAPQRLRDGELKPPSCLDITVSGELAICLTACTASTSAALRELLAWSAANDLGDLDGLSVITPTLEDAYLHLVAGAAAAAAAAG